ncbi:MAG TPA: hypothetical protein VLJ44_08935 [Gaiellaceae bacterium]|nr:hypothetical protein [Gaiellaceae bacterium]
MADDDDRPPRDDDDDDTSTSESRSGLWAKTSSGDADSITEDDDESD